MLTKEQIRIQLQKEKAVKQFKREWFCCEDMFRYLWDGEIALNYSPKFREWGIDVIDGGSSQIRIRYCPWCGSKLPESLGDKWFETLLEMGYENPFSDPIPDEYKTDHWWNKPQD